MDHSLLETLANTEDNIALFLRLQRVARWLLKRSPRSVEFFGDREELDRKYPLSHQLKPGNEVYGVWLTGEHIFTAHQEALRSNVVRGVVLPHPESENLKVLAESLGAHRPFYDFGRNIRVLTDLAKTFRVPVKWYRGGFIGTNILIVNPQRQTGWATMMIRLPYAEPDKFWAMRVERRSNETEFVRLWNVFDALFKGSDDPIPPEPVVFTDRKGRAWRLSDISVLSDSERNGLWAENPRGFEVWEQALHDRGSV